jgi:hypothetical protein
MALMLFEPTSNLVPGPRSRRDIALIAEVMVEEEDVPSFLGEQFNCFRGGIDYHNMQAEFLAELSMPLEAVL